MERVRQAIRTRHMSPRTEEAYAGWIRRFILFHGKRHPDQMGEEEVSAFLSALANQAKGSASTQNQALAALLFLYQVVLGRKLGWMNQIVHAKRPQRLPVVLSRQEVRAVLAELEGVPLLVASLLYGGGLRLLEAVTLRIKDLDLDLGKREISFATEKVEGPQDRRARVAYRTTSETPGPRSGSAHPRPRRGSRPGRSSRRPWPQILCIRNRLALAMAVPCHPDLSGARDRRTSPTPSP